MSRNDFDQACRHLARLDPIGFLCWVFGLTLADFRFVEWLDTRNAPLPARPTAPGILSL
jgi:hypothetical protein